MQFNQLPWWRTDTYDDSAALPAPFAETAPVWGPQGPGLVALYDDGKTAKGWGLRGTNGEPGFMQRYMTRQFSSRRILFGVERGAWHWAFIMRSVNAIAIDIDGKNGGLEHAMELGFLPPTLAEPSRSGNGYHLFYQTDDTWDDLEGFSKYHDHIGIVTGVDIRGTGCIYHYPSQRWNHRNMAMLPEALANKLLLKQQQRSYAKTVIEKRLDLDEVEILMMHQELLEELAKPIPEGKRNSSLFAIGTKMLQAQVPDWQDKVIDRGLQLGLDAEELDKLVQNIERYA